MSFFIEFQSKSYHDAVITLEGFRERKEIPGPVFSFISQAIMAAMEPKGDTGVWVKATGHWYEPNSNSAVNSTCNIEVRPLMFRAN